MNLSERIQNVIKSPIRILFSLFCKKLLYFHSTISKEPTAFETANPGCGGTDNARITILEPI